MNQVRMTYAEGKRIQITNAQERKIKQLYKEAADEVKQRAKLFENRTNISSIMRTQYLKDLEKQINDRMREIDSKTYSIIEDGMHDVASAVVKNNAELMKQMGFSETYTSTAYLYVPDRIVKEIATGQIYEGRWSLSARIWGDNKQKIEEVHTIVAKGLAENKSTFGIAKDLESYVRPGAKKPWDWSKVYPGTRKVIDYNAQRLARTMVSHGFQESFVRTTKNNPFIESYRWEASNSDRVCAICKERDGQIFQKDELPLDHPNGMCTFTIVMEKTLEEVGEELNAWQKGLLDDEENEKIQNFVDDLIWK